MAVQHVDRDYLKAGCNRTLGALFSVAKGSPHIDFGEKSTVC